VREGHLRPLAVVELPLSLPCSQKSAEELPKTTPTPPPPPRAVKPAREHAPWATWYRTTRVVRAEHPGNLKPAAPRLRQARHRRVRHAPRRELSKSVEFLKIGSLHQMLWLSGLA
jgi:hypothetical protein